MNPAPGPENGFRPDLAGPILASHRQWTGRSLVDGAADPAAALYRAPLAVLAHGTQADPVFHYGNRTAQERFALDWDALTRLPSRKSAEPLHREERARLLDRVHRHGYIDDYAGVRIGADGRRFRIEGATVWTLVDDRGTVIGQAAAFDRWTEL